MSLRKKTIPKSKDLVFVIILYTLLALFFLITIYPIIFVISASFSETYAVSTGQMLLFPVNPSLRAYEFIMGYSEIWTGYANTIFYTIFGTIINLAITIPCAYALSRKDCPFRSIIMMLFMITAVFLHLLSAA